jgi:hypothetical protein
MSGSTANPQIPQGNLNRARGNIQVPSYPALNISAPYLGEGGFTFNRSTPVTTFIPTLTGQVLSPEPYQVGTLEIHLVKSQALAAQWEAQLLNISILGNIVFYSDTNALLPYNFTQCGILNVGPIQNNGKSAEYMVTLNATYIINNALFALVV